MKIENTVVCDTILESRLLQNVPLAFLITKWAMTAELIPLCSLVKPDFTIIFLTDESFVGGGGSDIVANLMWLVCFGYALCLASLGGPFWAGRDGRCPKSSETLCD